jgi:hypothetical protein
MVIVVLWLIDWRSVREVVIEQVRTPLMKRKRTAQTSIPALVKAQTYRADPLMLKQLGSITSLELSLQFFLAK